LAVAVVVLSVELRSAASAAVEARFATGETEASARVEATISRVVGNMRVTLQAATVPALAAADVVDVTHHDYTRRRRA
jgi:hypothetical protein